MTKVKEIFISHSELDKEIVSLFVESILISTMSFKSREIFCTSIEGMKITTGEDWRKEIRKNLIGAKIVFLIITSNYKSSEICMNEMGAAWACCDTVIPLIVKPIDFNQIGPLYEVKQAEILNDELSLDRVRDRLKETYTSREFDIPSDRWTAKKKEMLRSVNDYIDTNPFPLPLSKETVCNLEEEIDKFKTEYGNLKSSYKELLKEKEKLKSYCDKLENLKDAEEVVELKMEYNDTDEIDEFNRIVIELKNNLEKHRSSVITRIYNEYSGMSLGIDMNMYGDDLAAAQADGILDDEFSVIWRGTKQIQRTKSLLDEIQYFIKECSEDTCKWFESEYPDVNMDINNKQFWEKVIRVRLSYS